MKVAVFVLVVLFLQVFSASSAEELKPNQQRMKACNTQADQKALKAGERNHFMRACLKGAKSDGRALSPHQQRSQECSAQARAKRLEGAERRGFMSECEKPGVKQDVAHEEKMKGCEKRAKKRGLEDGETRNYIRGCTKGEAAGKSG